ncbi:MAG: alpha/beta hydrolase [Actinomycetota bacterium]|nr:alpha/beta hydrolase [Actinomycetota bacterium]
MIVDTAAAQLYVEVAGTGAPLLSVSGSGSALGGGVPAAGPPVVERFTVASYDHRGLGRSTGEDRALTMGDFAADGFAVAAALGWSEFSLLGPSFGGMVAMEMAVTEPERITRLVLCSTSSGGHGGSSYPLHKRPGPSEWLALMDTRPDAHAQIAAFFRGRPAPREPGYTRQLEARRAYDVWDRLPQVTAPTLVTAGRYDAIAPPGNGEAIAARIHGARFELFEGGHAFLYQDPRAWPAIVDFLTGGS